MGIKEAVRILPEPVRDIAFGSIGVNYAAIGTPLEHPCHILYVQNLTNATVWISFDGIENHFPVVAGSYILLDITSNKPKSAGFFIAKETTFWVKRLGTPTSGSVYLTSFYGR